MRVYIASPFFNDRQKNNVEAIRNRLLTQPDIFDVYSPMHDGILLTKTSSERALNITYSENIGELTRSDLVIVIMDRDEVYGYDTGTVWEQGYASALGKPILIYIPKGSKLNAMLIAGAKGYTDDPLRIIQLIYDVVIRQGVFKKSDYILSDSVREEIG